MRPSEHLRAALCVNVFPKEREFTSVGTKNVRLCVTRVTVQVGAAKQFAAWLRTCCLYESIQRKHTEDVLQAEWRMRVRVRLLTRQQRERRRKEAPTQARPSRTIAAKPNTVSKGNSLMVALVERTKALGSPELEGGWSGPGGWTVDFGGWALAAPVP
jgi:hypothetical protein